MGWADMPGADVTDGLRLGQAQSRGFDGGLVNEHDGNVVFDRVYAVALRTLQAFGVLAVLERLLTGGTDQNVQQIFGNHGRNCTPPSRAGFHQGVTENCGAFAPLATRMTRRLGGLAVTISSATIPAV
jgi:hypothetical protein